jgi:hypothetical protein
LTAQKLKRTFALFSSQNACKQVLLAVTLSKINRQRQINAAGMKYAAAARFSERH